MKSKTPLPGTIHVDEAYSKQELMQRLRISQKYWDKMLDDGLPFTTVGKRRFVMGRAIIEHLSKHAKRKREP